MKEGSETAPGAEERAGLSERNNMTISNEDMYRAALARPNYILVDELLEMVLATRDSADAIRYGDEFLDCFASVIEDWAEVYRSDTRLQQKVVADAKDDWRDGPYDTGSAQQILRAVLAEIGQREDDLESLSGYLSGHVARTMQWFASDGGADEEATVDLAIMILARLQGDASWTLSVAERLVPRLWAILRRKTRRDSDWLISLSSLGVLFSNIRNRVSIIEEKRRSSLDGVCYYQAALAYGAGWVWPEGAALDAEPPSMRLEALGQAANNLAACLAELRDQDITHDREKYREIMGCLANMAMAAVPRTPGTHAAGGPILERLGFPDGVVSSSKDALSILDRMMMVSTLLPLEKGSFDIAWSYTCAAVARTVLKVGKRVGTAFFNGGVQLARIAAAQNIEGADYQAMPKLEALMYALGFFWATSVNATEKDALSDGDGLDCAINLLTTLPENVQAGLAPFGRYLFDAMHRHSDKFNANDVARGLLTLRRIWDKSLEETKPSKDPARDLVRVMAPLIRELGVAAFDWSSEVACADALMKLFRRVFNPKLVEASSLVVAGLVEGFLEQTADAKELLKANYKHECFHPMVAVCAGFIDTQEWSQIKAKFFPDYAGDIGQAFHEAFSQDRGSGGGRGR